MATKDEYEKVYGKVPGGRTPATEWGDGGCYVILRETTGEVIGRWALMTEANEVYSKLAPGAAHRYVLQASHHFVSTRDNMKCQRCGMSTADMRRNLVTPR